jgi:hypothetical protein
MSMSIIPTHFQHPNGTEAKKCKFITDHRIQISTLYFKFQLSQIHLYVSKQELGCTVTANKKPLWFGLALIESRREIRAYNK